MFTSISGTYSKLLFLNLESDSVLDLKYLGHGLAKVRLKILPMDLGLDLDSDLWVRDLHFDLDSSVKNSTTKLHDRRFFAAHF